MISKSQLKYIQSLGQKKHRDDAGVFIAEGPKLVNELLKMPSAEVLEIYALNDWVVQQRALPSNTKVSVITEKELERITQLRTPNQVIAVIKKFPAKPIRLANQLTLVLDAIQNPGNLGTILRIADWFGVKQIICSLECADVYNPKVVQSTMGSIARVSVIYTDLVEFFKKQTMTVYAAMLEGKNIFELSAVKEGLLLIGNESKGIHEKLIPFVTEKITIPKKGQAESLNAAVATGIILSHLT